MLATMKLKEDLRFLQELHWVLEVMKRIAAAQLKHLERVRPAHANVKKDFKTLLELFAMARVPSVLWKPVSQAAGVLCITSNTGFVGDLNVRVAREALGLCRAPSDSLFVIGDQGSRIVGEEGRPLTAFSGIDEAMSLTGLTAVAHRIGAGYLKEDFGSLTLVYPRYVSLTQQDIVVEQALPVPQEEVSRPPAPAAIRELVMESPAQEIERQAVSWWIWSLVTQAVWQAKLSELAARTTHLEGACDELNKQSGEINLQYFRAVHEEMDQSIREVYASRLQEMAR